MPLRKVLALLGIACWTAAARADDVSSLFFFGDSLTDQGRNGFSAPVLWSGVLRGDLGVTSGANYAIGGATSGNQASAVFGNSGYLGQVNTFLTSGAAVPPGTEAGVWIGTNDISIGTVQGLTPAQVASATTGNVLTGLGSLAGAGIHQVVLLGVYDLSLTNAYDPKVDAPAVRSRAAAASSLYNSQLAAARVPGVTITYFDTAKFIAHLQANAAAYGFQQILPLQVGASCDAACQQSSIFDGPLHLSAKAQTLLGDYVATGNPVYNADPLTYGALESDIESAAAYAPLPAELARTATETFTRSVLDRFDALRDARHGASPSASPWSVFSYGDVTGGALANTPAAVTLDTGYVSAGATVGTEYRLSSDLLVGGAFNYTHVFPGSGAGLTTGTGLDGFQGAAFTSLSRPDWFADGVVAGGAEQISQHRSGTFGTIGASPLGTTVGVAGQGGYLLGLGPVRVGPLLGFSFSHVSIGSFAEQGGSLGAVLYPGQSSDSVIGSAGLELRGPWAASGFVQPFLTVAYDHEFLGVQTIRSSLASVPTQALPIASVNPGVDAVRTAAGLSFAPAPGWEASVTAFGLLGHQDVTAYGGTAGATYRF